MASLDVDETAPARRALVLAPFRGLRFDASAVGDLGSVISPPYDVLDAETVRRLEAANRRNIVRLILSRRFERPYRAVRRRLEAWRDRGYLVADDHPGLYLYEYTVEGVTVRGLIGLLGLREEHEGVVLPHEEVMEAPVEDRAVLMRTTETNLEPILLVHDGTTDLRGILTEIAAEPPVEDFTTADGSRHRLWQVVSADRVARIARALAPGRALIADGHHRYAAYQRLQAEHPGSHPAAWDFGLAMLVDQSDYPLTIGPIHRTVAALTLADVHDVAEDRGDRFELCADRSTALAVPSTADEAAFALSDGAAWAVLRTPRHGHEVDAAVLHEVLLAAWETTEEQVGYHHSLDQALRTTSRQPGISIAVRPPDLDQVVAASARGVRLPRKSTSFAPKPRMGVVMRDLRDC